MTHPAIKKTPHIDHTAVALAQTFSRVAATDDGLVVFRTIMSLCGFKLPSIVGDPSTGDIHDRGTLYNESRRNVYLDVRKFIRPDILDNIERNAVQELMTEEPTDV